MGRTNIVLNDKLVKQAMAIAKVKTKRELIDKLLTDYVKVKRQKNIIKLFGKGLLDPNYDHEAEYGGTPPRKREDRMILVDTSIWVTALDRPGHPLAKRLEAILRAERPIAVTPDIVLEVLQGARDASHLAKLKKAMDEMLVLEPSDRYQTYIDAARIYAECRWLGITPRSSIDCLISQIAIEYDVQLMHNDRDFEYIQTVVPKLRLL